MAITKRYKKQPKKSIYGDTDLSTVREGNLVNERVSLLRAICSMLKIASVIEQPASSFFFHTEMMRFPMAAPSFHEGFWVQFQQSTLLFGVADFLRQSARNLKQGRQGPADRERLQRRSHPQRSRLQKPKLQNHKVLQRQKP